MSDTGESPFPRNRWSELAAGKGGARAYQKRFDDLADAGEDVHGEASFVATLVKPPARVLDAGCGTGRVATELSRLGYVSVGVDADEAMVAVAKQRDPTTYFVVQDLADLFLQTQAFDVVVLAGNVVPLLAPGTLPRVMRRIAAHTRPGGQVVAGFGLDAAHLPPGCPVTPVEDYEMACAAAGLSPELRFGTWGRERWSADVGYVVALHRLT